MRIDASRNVAVKAALITAAAAILILLAYEVAHGTLRMFALGLFVALAVPLCYVAIERPLIFPFGLYVILAPFEAILAFGHFGTINKLLGMLTFAAVIFSLIRRGRLVKPSPAMLAWLAVLVWMGISGFWTIDPANWQAAYLTIAQDFILYVAVGCMIATVSDVEILSTCVVVGGLAASAVAVWPLISGGTILTPGARITLPGDTPQVHADPNVFAASLLIPYAILFSSTLATRRLVSLAGNASGLLLIAVTIVVSGSRAAMLAGLVLTLYIIITNRRRTLVAMGLVLVAAAAIVPFGFDIQNRWSNAISSGGAGREEIWKVAVLAFKQHWLFGWGFGSFEAAFDRFVLQAPLQAYVSWHRAPHDIVIQMAVDLGVFGIIIVAIAFFMQLKDLWLPGTGGVIDDLRIALQAAMIGICVDTMFLDVLDKKFLWVLFTLIALLRSTVISAHSSDRLRRRISCATPSSLTPDPISAPAK